MANEIKFSHKYEKLKWVDCNTNDCDSDWVYLLDVIPVKLENLSKQFLAYDTEDKFVLPPVGSYLLLILQKQDYNICTTLRPYTAHKLEYYRNLIGEELGVVYV